MMKTLVVVEAAAAVVMYLPQGLHEFLMRWAPPPQLPGSMPSLASAVMIHLSHLKRILAHV